MHIIFQKLFTVLGVSLDSDKPHLVCITPIISLWFCAKITNKLIKLKRDKRIFMLQCFDRKICIFVTGLGVSLDSDKPHLVGIDEDVSSTGITLYHLLDGATNIGSEEKTNDIGSDFVLQISSLLSQIFSHLKVTQKWQQPKVEQFTKLQILNNKITQLPDFT